jgi:hypothetical protein
MRASGEAAPGRDGRRPRGRWRRWDVEHRDPRVVELADLFESYSVMLVAALILGQVAFGNDGLVFPLIVTGIGVITAVAGISW